MSNLIPQLAPLLLPLLLSALPLPPSLKTPAVLRKIQITLLTAYIAYTLLSSTLSIGSQGNFYQFLSVGRAEGEKGLKDAWKAWARRNHPDRVRGESIDLVERRFVVGRAAFDCLSDDGRRWAYDRFGDQVMKWKGLVTQKEYFLQGLVGTGMFYVISAGVQAFSMLIHRENSSLLKFWRNLTLPALLILELTLLVSPSPSADVGTPPLPIRALNTIFPSRTQHQQILFLRDAYTAINMAINMLGPLVLPRIDPPIPHAEEEERTGRLMDRVQGLVTVLEGELTRVYHTELYPVLAKSPNQEDGPDSERGREELEIEPALEGALREEMEDVLVDSRIRSHPAVGSAWREAVERRRRVNL